MAVKIDSEIAHKAMLKVGLKPLEPYRNSIHAWKSICIACDELNFRSLKSVIRNNNGCVYCSKKKVNPQKAVDWMRENGLEPVEPYPGGKKPWKCICKRCGKKVSPSYRSPTQRKKPACAYCSKVRVDVAEIISKMILNGYQPLEPYVNSMKPWKCKCLKCGRTGYPRWSQVQSYDSRCQYCSRNKITETHAIEVMRAAGYLPLEPYKSSKTKWKCRHIKCGSVVFPKLNTISNGTGGCRSCASIGFEVNKPGYLYFMYHPEYFSYKVGISNSDSKPNRVETHKRQGWKTIKIFSFASGWQVLYLETQFFIWLRREKGIPPHLSKSEMKRGGWYETFAEDEISQGEVLNKLSREIKQLKQLASQ